MYIGQYIFSVNIIESNFLTGPRAVLISILIIIDSIKTICSLY